MTSNVQYPAMRDEVISALQSLSDQEYQRSHWLVPPPDESYYDDLALNVHILYDDCKVLPDPSSAVGAVLVEADVPALLALEEVLGPLLDELGDSPDEIYLADPRWSQVVAAASAALAAMDEA